MPDEDARRRKQNLHRIHDENRKRSRQADEDLKRRQLTRRKGQLNEPLAPSRQRPGSTSAAKPESGSRTVTKRSARPSAGIRSLWVLGIVFGLGACGVVAFMLWFGGDDGDYPSYLRLAAQRADTLAQEAYEINERWDKAEGFLPEPDRRELYDETKAQLESIRDRTIALAGDLESASNTERTAFEARSVQLVAINHMVEHSRRMLDGLAERRGEKEERLSGLADYVEAAEQVRQALDSRR